MRTFNSRQNCWLIKTRKIKTFSDQAKLKTTLIGALFEMTSLLLSMTGGMLPCL